MLTPFIADRIPSRNDLQERGIHLKGIQDYPDLPSLKARYKELGFERACAIDMKDAYTRLLDPRDLRR
jgi:hypothetical protein